MGASSPLSLQESLSVGYVFLHDHVTVPNWVAELRDIREVGPKALLVLEVAGTSSLGVVSSVFVHWFLHPALLVKS